VIVDVPQAIHRCVDRMCRQPTARKPCVANGPKSREEAMAYAAVALAAIIVGFIAGLVTFKRSFAWCPKCGVTLRCLECASQPEVQAADTTGLPGQGARSGRAPLRHGLHLD
jgi:hypothetical protein